MKETTRRIRKRHIKNIRSRRGSTISDQPHPIHHSASHHPIAHPKELPPRHLHEAATEGTVFDASEIEAKLEIENRIVRKVSDVINFSNELLHQIVPLGKAKSTDQTAIDTTTTMHQLSKVVPIDGRDYVLFGTFALEEISKKLSNLHPHVVSLGVVNTTPDGISIQDTVITIDFTTGIHKRNDGQPADLTYLQAANIPLKAMRRELLREVHTQRQNVTHQD